MSIVHDRRDRGLPSSFDDWQAALAVYLSLPHWFRMRDRTGNWRWAIREAELRREESR